MKLSAADSCDYMSPSDMMIKYTEEKVQNAGK